MCYHAMCPSFAAGVGVLVGLTETNFTATEDSSVLQVQFTAQVSADTAIDSLPPSVAIRYSTADGTATAGQCSVLSG